MQTELNQLPDSQTLAHSLNAILSDDVSLEDQLAILSRERSLSASTFLSEVVTCRLSDGRRLRFFFKYAAGHNHNAYGHRGGVSYEAEVYHHVLQRLPITVPRFYGSHKSTSGEEAWIVLGFLDECSLVSDSADPAPDAGSGPMVGTISSGW